MSLTTKWYTDFEGLEEIERCWRFLFGKSVNQNPFLSWEWISNWLSTFHPEGKILCSIGYNDSGTPVLVMGFLSVSTIIDRLAGVNRWRLLGAGESACADHLELLVDPGLSVLDQNQLIAEILERFADGSSILELPSLDRDSKCVENLLRRSDELGLTAFQLDGPVCPVVHFSGNWDEYLSTVSSNFRAQVRKSLRRASSDLEFVRIDDAKEVAHAIEALIEMSIKRHKLRGSTSTLCEVEMTRFVTQLLPGMMTQNTCWVDALKSKGEFVAVSVNLIGAERIFYYQGAFDERFASYRPSTVLFALVMQRGIRLGFKSYDFLRGGEDYKKRWAKDERRDIDVTIFSPVSRAALLAQAKFCRRRIVKWLANMRFLAWSWNSD